MSELAIVTSDIHIHQYKAFNEGGRRLRNGIAYLDYLFELAHTNKIKYILMPGDLFNNMQIIATSVVNEVSICLKNNFDSYPEIKIIAISGNHDYGTKNLIDAPGDSALRHLEAIFPDNFVLLDYPDNELVFMTNNKNVIWGIPYYEYPEHFREVLQKTAEYLNLKKNYNVFLLMHQVVASGLPIEDHIEATDPLFDNFDFVFNGHIHDNQQVTDKFINVGSPMHRDASDIGKKKGFWIVDLDDPVNTISFKDITDRYPQFIHKNAGEELTEWEKQQYIILVPVSTPEESSDNSRNEKFQNTLTPQKLMENYCNEILPKEEVKDKLAYGLTLLQL